MLIAVDTECGGLDLHHGVRPFFVTACKEDGEQLCWEWDVDPLTRRPIIPPADLDEIRGVLDAADELVGQNFKFDGHALSYILDGYEWPWHKCHDTLLAAHLLASNRPKDLTSLAIQYLGIDIEPKEQALAEAVQACRRKVQQAQLRVKRGKGLGDPLEQWRIASAGLPEMPSAKSDNKKEANPWRADYWLPRAYAKQLQLPPEHPYWTVLSAYANTDSEVTLLLWRVMRDLIKKRGLWAIYEHRRQLLPVTFRMERRGVTASKSKHAELTAEFAALSEQAGRVCVNIAAGMGHNLELPANGVNASLRTFCFDVLKLEPLRGPKAKTDAPTLDAKTAMPHYLATLEQGTKQRLFVTSLLGKRKRDTALAYLESYARFWLDAGGGVVRLHPSFNVVGTDTLRFSCQNPNVQQLSKQEEVNLRRMFGPAPGREWWSLDAKNIELRIPAYLSGEREVIDLFERPDEPPYYGSTHLLNFSTVYPDLWEQVLAEVGIDKVGPTCKKRFAPTWYQWCKNGGFAVQYGAIDRADGSGTADRAFHRPGSHARLKARFSKLEALNRQCIDHANRHGYVETVPDRAVDPRRGYPLLCSRSEHGKILPTVPLNYKIQGSAMDWTCKAMVRCQRQLDEWRATDGFDGHIVLQVHDEMVFDLPAAGHPKRDPERSNLGRILVLKDLMEQGGRNFLPAIPTPVGVEFHQSNWGEGETLY